MERKDFLKLCGGSCLGLIGISVFTESCSPTHYVQAVVNNNTIQISKAEFIVFKNDTSNFRKYLIVKTDKLDFPIVVYRNSDTSYTALFMKCTHQGVELSVNGDILTCSAHNSEFSNKGEIIQGPADQKLRSFPVTSDEANIYLQLS